MSIESAEWNTLEHAYGTAEDVPKLLKDLCSTNIRVVDEALKELFSTIWHQGTVYEATVKALPLLLEIYDEHKVIQRDSLAMLILSIAAGSGYYQVHRQIPVANPFEKGVVGSPPNLHELLDKENAVVEGIRTVFAKHLNSFVSYLEHEESELRLVAARAFGCYSDNKSITLPLLWESLKKEHDEEVLTCLEESVLKLEKNLISVSS